MPSDKYYIKETFKLARRAEGKTSPNPLVGAVVVKKNKIVARGYHKKAGCVHAEIEALKKIKSGLKGATLYVNLEPCFHWGRTPPCVDKILSSKIKRVVAAIKDPNPFVSGKSIRKLKRKGLQVKVGILEKEAERINEVFFKNMKKRLPFVAAKMAQTIDGKIADSWGNSKWITHKASRRQAKHLRGLYDAVLVGINTVRHDNPSLNVLGKKVIKIILDPNFKLSPRAPLFKGAKKVLIFTKKNIKNQKKKALLNENVEIISLPYRKNGFNLRRILKILYSYEICSVFIEGGSCTLGKFFDAKLVDKMYVFVAAKIMGKKNALCAIGGEGRISMRHITNLRDVTIEKIGKDYLICGYPDFK